MIETVAYYVTEVAARVGFKVLGIIAGAFLIRQISKLVIAKIVRAAVVPDDHVSDEAELKREETIIHVFSGAFGVMLWVVAVMMIVSEFGIDVGPLIAGAGIIGVAIGFGGQYLIRDVISGLFMILENQYRVGDSVCLNDTCGVVEEISLRVTVLRDLDGVVHHIPNGEIKLTSNKSKSFSRINLNVGISYESDLKKAIATIEEVGKKMAAEKTWKAKLKKRPTFLRVDDLADSAVVLKIVGETKPGDQWSVTGELRKRIKLAFDKAGIDIPYPQLTIHQK